APASDNDLEVAYAVTVGAAVAVHGGNVAAAAYSPAGELVAAGDDVEGLRQSVLTYLPPPDTDIPGDVDPPPPPPGLAPSPGIGSPDFDPATGCPIGWIADGEICF